MENKPSNKLRNPSIHMVDTTLQLDKDAKKE